MTSVITASAYDVDIIQSPNQTITVTLGKIQVVEGKDPLFIPGDIPPYAESFDFPENLVDTHIKVDIEAVSQEYIVGEIIFNGAKYDSKPIEIVKDKYYQFRATPARSGTPIMITYSAPGSTSISFTELKAYANNKDTLYDAAKLANQAVFPEIVYPGNTIYSSDTWKNIETNESVVSSTLLTSSMTITPYKQDQTDDFEGAIKAYIKFSDKPWVITSDMVSYEFNWLNYDCFGEVITDYQPFKDLVNADNACIEIRIGIIAGETSDKTKLYPHMYRIEVSFSTEYFYALYRHRYIANTHILNLRENCTYKDYPEKINEFESRTKPGVPPYKKSKYFLNIKDTEILFEHPQNPNKPANALISPIYGSVLDGNTNRDAIAAEMQKLQDKAKEMLNNGTLLNYFPITDIKSNAFEIILKRD